jgi:hypothetical protein
VTGFVTRDARGDRGGGSVRDPGVRQAAGLLAHVGLRRRPRVGEGGFLGERLVAPADVVGLDDAAGELLPAISIELPR